MRVGKMCNQHSYNHLSLLQFNIFLTVRKIKYYYKQTSATF